MQFGSTSFSCRTDVRCLVKIKGAVVTDSELFMLNSIPNMFFEYLNPPWFLFFEEENGQCTVKYGFNVFFICILFEDKYKKIIKQ